MEIFMHACDNMIAKCITSKTCGGLILKEEIFMDRIVKLFTDKISRIMTIQMFLQEEVFESQGVNIIKLWKMPGTRHAYPFMHLFHIYKD